MRPSLVAAVIAASLSLAPRAHAQQPRTVHIQVTDSGYNPPEVIAEPGEHLLLVFENDGTAGCCKAIVVPAAHARGLAQPGEPLLVELTVPKRGVVPFYCTMKMCHGQVRVERRAADEKSPAPAERSPGPASKPDAPAGVKRG